MPKRYGQSMVDNCPFCGKIAVVRNKEGVPTCSAHKGEKLKEMKCICGNWLEFKKGKFGSYFFCIKCGNISFRKAIEANTASKGTQTKRVSSYKPKEITVTSDQLDYM
jgi:hypothetical protein